MRRPIVLLLTLVAATGGWLFFRELPDERSQLAGGYARSKSMGSVSSSEFPVAGMPIQRLGETIHLATFNIQVFGRTKTSKAHVMDTLATIARQFDVLAIQEVRCDDQDVIPRLVDHINAAGRIYDYVMGPRVGRVGTSEQFAFVFDRKSIEVDRFQLYTVRDPDDLLHWEPLVAWFRVVGPPADEAFTFTLVNVHIDSEKAEQELSVLGEIFGAVRDDGRGEDDVIVMGDFDADASRLDQLIQSGAVLCATRGIPTDTRGTAPYDNILFSKQATLEFTGRAGVFDFMRQFNLTMDEAMEISDHLPVWAEFGVYEGGQPGRIAADW